MSVSAGYGAKVYYSADDSSYAEVAHLTKAQVKIILDQLDTTNFKSSGGDKNRLAGLREVDFGTFSGDYDAADTGGQVAWRAAILARTAHYVKVLVDGTNGFKCAVTGESFTLASEVAGKTTFECTVKSNGAPTAIP